MIRIQFDRARIGFGLDLSNWDRIGSGFLVFIPDWIGSDYIVLIRIG